MKGFKETSFSANPNGLTEKALLQSIAVSVISIFLCIVILCSATWAWFITSISSPTSNIRSAHCDVTVWVTDGSSTILPENGTYRLQKNTAYTFTITADGTAENAYCVLKIDGLEYYTEPFDMVNINGTLTGSFSFSLYFQDQDTSTVAVEVITRWGKSSNTATFQNNEKYVNLARVDVFPLHAPELTATAESDTAEPNNAETTVAETTAVTEPTVTSE